MDLFQHRYYRLGKILMCLIGQWPYQSARLRRGIVAVLILSTTYQIVAQILPVVKYWKDWNIVLECLVPNIFDAVCGTKYLGFICNPQKTLKLLNRIRTDWQVWALDRDVNILHEYASRGERLTIIYTVAVYAGLTVFMIQPMIIKLIDVVLRNGTEPGRFAFPVVYYHLDAQKYYLSLIMYCTTCAFIIMTFSVASGVMLIIHVQHVCSIFTAVGRKLERIGSSDTEETEESRYALASICIERHNDAIEYAELIKASYAWNSFFAVGFGVILVNASGLQILLRKSDFVATLKFIVLIMDLLFYFYIECYISQLLLDHSLSIRLYIQNSQWYRLSPKTQKLLQLMILRCNVPCQLTLGNMLNMSVQSFGMTVRTAASYFAFVRSMQGV